MEFSHRSVLLWECIEALNIRPDGVYLDGTLGGAGHSLEICRNLTTGRLIGVDRDPVALEAAAKRLQSHLGKVTLVHDNFENIASILERLGLDGVDGILLDLGVSSPQLDDGARGFSYMADAPLDMRMDRSEGLTAADIVIHYDPWWNVAAQNQATDRAYRIGQEKPVTVYKLILKDTIEENLLKLQNAKLALAAQVVSEGMVSLGDLSQNELMELFEQNP